MTAALAAAVLSPSSAAAAGVVVRLPDREVRLDEAALRGAADVPAGTATLRGEGAAADTIAHPAAVSLPRVLELAGVAPEALSFVSIRRPNGTLALLRSADLARPAPFPEGPPLVWLDADSVRYLRPVRDDADVNATDNLATAGQDLLVRVHQGPLLQVTVRVDPGAPRAGRLAHLEARVEGAQPGVPVRLRWQLGDGTEAVGAAIAHRWRRPGVYAVVASADGDDDSGGASEPVVVTVGEPRERRGPAGGGGGDPERAPAVGPAEPPEDPVPPASGPAPAPTPAPSVRPQRRDRAAGERASRARPDGARRRRRRPAAAPPGTEPVRGVLVDASVPASVAGAAPPPAARPGSPAGRDAITLPAGAALAAGLLGLGARRERRRRPR